MNHLSRYTHLIDNGKNYFLFNIFTDKTLALQPELARLIADNREHIDTIREIHPQLYEVLQNEGYMVPSDKNEVEEVLKCWKEEDCNPEFLSIIVLPTLDCNLRCWYCYEEHNAGTVMKEDVLDRIRKLIDVRTSSPELKRLNISFFGGEPLMGFNKIVFPLLSYAKQLCKERQKQLTVGFTTNGTLFNTDMVGKLKSLDAPIQLQITLDGNREKHDSVRCTRQGGKTYDMIVANIKLLLRNGFSVTCRLNYTSDNIETLKDIVPDFKDISQEDRRLLNFYMQQVWQDKAEKCIEKQEENILASLRRNRLRTGLPSRCSKHRCYADAENSICINYNGDVHKCTARDFKPEVREGELKEDGSIEYNEKYRKRMMLKFGYRSCQECSIYPMCHGGGCSQDKLERDGIMTGEGCAFNYTEKDKMNLVCERLKAKIEMMNPN